MGDSIASEKILTRILMLLMIALATLKSFSTFERSRQETVIRLQVHAAPARRALRSVHPNTNTFLPLLGSENTKDNMIQALVLSPKKGIVVAIGTVDVHDCPQPDYQRRHLTLSFGDQAFPITRFNQFRGYSGPLVVAHFNVTIELWDKLRQSPFPLQVHNRADQTTQQLTPMVDPALTQGWDQHKLSATVTVRKKYRFYKGRDPVNQKKDPQTWSAQHTQERLDWWIRHYRSLGVQHFYIVDNEHDQHLPNLMVNGTDVTYIRAANHEYDYYSCARRQDTVSGQSLLENMVIRMAHTEWLIVLDVDEFIVPGEPFQDNLVSFLDHYKSIHCVGHSAWKLTNITCDPLQQYNRMVHGNNYTYNERIYAMSFPPIIVKPRGRITPDSPHRRKNILMPTYTAYLDVHDTKAFNDRKNVESHIPSKRAYMAHLQDHHRSQHVMADIVPNLRNNHDRLFDTE